MNRPISIEKAKAKYVHRFTMEHVPQWAKTQTAAGSFYAPQFSTDKEWYDNTKFPSEPKLTIGSDCYTTGQTWPMGQWLDKPYVIPA